MAPGSLGATVVDAMRPDETNVEVSSLASMSEDSYSYSSELRDSCSYVAGGGDGELQYLIYGDAPLIIGIAGGTH